MRDQLRAILSIYIVLMSIYLVFGKSQIDAWSALYFLNMAFLTIGVMLAIRGYVETVLVDIVIGLSGVYSIYNVIVLINRDFANKINTCFWGCLVLVVIIISVLIWKTREK